MKTIFKLTLLFVILFAISCSPESMTDPNLDNSSAKNLSSDLTSKKNANSKKVTRSISNSLESDDYAEAGPLGGFKFYGTMTHLGKIKGIGVTIDIIDNGDGTFNFISDDVIIGANGDEVHAKSNIRFIVIDDETGTYTGGAEITGGTGRFYGASGYLIFENALYDLTTGHASHDAYGEITY